MSLVQDLRFTLRQLRRSPGFTAAAVVTLAIGIGASTAMFSVVDTVLLSPLPFRDPDRLVRLESTNLDSGGEAANVNPLDLRDWQQAEPSTFSEIEGVNYRRFVVRAGDGEVERVRGARATPGFLSMLGVQPVLGRTFSDAERTGGGGDVVVLSNALWRQSFGGDRNVIGRTLEVNGSPHAVVGVLPDDFHPPLASELPLVWVPLRIEETMGRGGLWLLGFGRLAPGVSVEQGRQEMASLAGEMARRFPATNDRRGVQVTALKNAIVGDLERPLLILLSAVGLVLLIACVNVANLLLARGAVRKKELTVRAAVGAGSGRLLRQMVTESLVLSFAGGALGIALTALLNRTVVRLAAGQVARIENLSIDGTVLAFTLGLAILTGLAFGLVPALRTSRLDLRSGLSEGGRSDAPGGRRLPTALVVAEMALALLLLIGAGLLLRSFSELLSVDVGFDPHGVATLEVDLPEDGYGGEAQRRDFYLRLLDEVRSLPRVTSASAIDMLPFSGYYSCNSLTVPDGSVPNVDQRLPCAEYRTVADDYFDTLGIDVLEGRALRASDDAGTRPVAVVNRTLARLLWPEGHAVGHTLGLSFAEEIDHEVVGVVEDVHHFGLDADVQPEVYVSHRQQPSGWMTLVVRTDGDPAALVPLLRDRVHSLDANLPLNAPGTLSASISQSVTEPRLRTVILTAFAAVALFLAAVGMFGVLAYSVARRTQEIGLRLALGAQRRNVLGMVVRQSMSAAGLGVLLGLAGAVAALRLLQGLLYGISTTDVWTYVLSPVLLLLVALVASYVPARRASRIEPQIALRES